MKENYRAREQISESKAGGRGWGNVWPLRDSGGGLGGDGTVSSDCGGGYSDPYGC